MTQMLIKKLFYNNNVYTNYKYVYANMYFVLILFSKQIQKLLLILSSLNTYLPHSTYINYCLLDHSIAL